MHVWETSKKNPCNQDRPSFTIFKTAPVPVSWNTCPYIAKFQEKRQSSVFNYKIGGTYEALLMNHYPSP